MAFHESAPLRWAAAAGSALCFMVATLTLGAAPAQAKIRLTQSQIGYVDSAGRPVAQAGAHPNVVVRFIPETRQARYSIMPVEAPHRFISHTPPGVVGNPMAAGRCEQAGMKAGASGHQARCPVGSQIGYAEVYFGNLPGDPFAFPVRSPIYNVVPPDGAPALFGFNVLANVVLLTPTVRNGDYGISIDSGAISQGIKPTTVDVVLWGVPADPANDASRVGPVPGSDYAFPPASSQSPVKPFMSLPTRCTGQPASTSFRVDGWDSIGDYLEVPSVKDADGGELVVTGCDKLEFQPEVKAAVTSRVADAPSGIVVDVTVPQNESPRGFSTAHVKDVSVRLPVGMSVSPSSAAGLTACTDAQFGLGTDSVVGCAESSKVGTVTIDTPLLERPMGGSVYVGTQESSDPMSGRLFRLFVDAQGPGVNIKLEGGVQADPVTGQLTTTFANNPQLPFTALRMELFDGPDASLATPARCGRHTTEATVTSWSGKSVSSSSSFEIDCRAGLGGFSPSFVAGAVQPRAGAFSPFAVSVGKPDGDAPLTGLRMMLPDGLTARLAGSEGTVVGSVQSLAGPGSSPFPLPGTVTLEGAYGDAPFSLRVVVPAKAGPFDLGNVVVRQRIYVDRATARVSVVSDPIPTIVSGVPVRMQRLDVNVDKPGFMINPTSCAAKTIEGALSSASGATANQSVRFQVGDCGSLPFKPRMTFKVGSRGKTSNGKRTPFEARLWMTPGQASNRVIEVTLPKILNARLDVVDKRTACTIEQFNADRCPQVVGVASAETPLLKDPLRGAAFFVYNPARRLPDLVVRLKGQVNVDLVGKVTITRALELQTTFDTIPDVPITQFQLSLMSGPRNGPIGVTRNLCAASTRKALAADLAFTAQSNKKISRAQKISVAGCGKASRASGRRAGRGRRASKAKRAGSGGRAGK